jgi:hypothetical protein
MAFQYLGEITGGLAPVIPAMQVGATVYSGQILIGDYTVSGEVIPSAVAVAGPDVTQKIIGICLGKGRNTSPGTSYYNSTYKGDTITYDTAVADQLLNDPIGAAVAQVQKLTPTSLIRAPLCHGTIGTAPPRGACTTGSSGATYVNATSGHATVSLFSTSYCYDGANRGEHRIITTGNATTQTHTILFPRTIATGDKFVWVNVRPGYAHVDWDSQFQAIDACAALTYYFEVYVHELNLEVAGGEYAVFSFAANHLA